MEIEPREFKASLRDWKPKPPGIRNHDLPEGDLERMVGPIPPGDFVSNGCSFVPDGYGDLRMDAPCHCHDYAYHLGGGWNAFREANYWFRRNLRNVGTPRWMAWLRWAAVTVAGVPFFNFDKPIRPVVEAACLGACMLIRNGDPRSVGAPKEISE